jgi:hypothetical protein
MNDKERNLRVAYNYFLDSVRTAPRFAVLNWAMRLASLPRSSEWKGVRCNIVGWNRTDHPCRAGQGKCEAPRRL